MKVENVKIPVISQQRFFELWEETQTETADDEVKIYNFFKPIIETIPQLTLGEHYWQIFNNAQPFPKIIMAEGAVNKLTPVDAKRLVNCSAEEIFSFYHPKNHPRDTCYSEEVEFPIHPGKVKTLKCPSPPQH